MDLYGVQIKMNDGTDLVTHTTPMFVLDYIQGSVSGSKTYEVPSGLSLRVSVNNMDTIDGKTVRASLSGNTLSYTCHSRSSIIVYAG